MNDDIRYGWGEIVSEGGTACTWDGGGAGKILQIRGLMLGQGRPKICVPVVETTSEAILQAARRVRASEAELLEWRADYWEEDEQTKRVGQMLREIRREIGEMPLLFTCRTRDEGGRFPGGPEYLRLNQVAIESARRMRPDGISWLRAMILQGRRQRRRWRRALRGWRNGEPMS